MPVELGGGERADNEFPLNKKICFITETICMMKLKFPSFWQGTTL